MNLALSKNMHPSRDTSSSDFLTDAPPVPLSQDARYLAHDARNWLTVLQVYCDLLRTSGAVARGYETWIEELSGAVERGHRLVASLLESLQPAALSGEQQENDPDSGRPTKDLRVIRASASGKSARGSAEDFAKPCVPAFPGSVDVGPALVRRLPFLQHLAGHNIQVEIDAPANTGNAMLPESVLERVLYNLVSNAIEAMPGGGRLRITARRSKRHIGNTDLAKPAKTLLLRITDTGNGIAPELLPNIFEAGISRKTRGEGLSGLHGYGLAIVRELVEQAGGAVRVRSRPGHGSCFEVKLPQAETHRKAFGHAAVTA